MSNVRPSFVLGYLPNPDCWGFPPKAFPNPVELFEAFEVNALVVNGELFPPPNTDPCVCCCCWFCPNTLGPCARFPNEGASELAKLQSHPHYKKHVTKLSWTAQTARTLQTLPKVASTMRPCQLRFPCHLRTPTHPRARRATQTKEQRQKLVSLRRLVPSQRKLAHRMLKVRGKYWNRKL